MFNLYKHKILFGLQHASPKETIQNVEHLLNMPGDSELKINKSLVYIV
jgi:hypothetical protein